MLPIAGLRCTVCRSPDLEFGADLIGCGTCGAAWPVLGGVPVMFDTVTMRDGERIDDDAARQVLAAFGLPDDPIARLRIRTVVRRQARFGGPLIEIESAQFLDRVRNTGHEIAATQDAAHAPAEGPFQGPAETAAKRTEALRDLATVPRHGWTRSYMPRRMAAGCELLANMRLENRGSVTLHRDGQGRALVGVRWQYPSGAVVAQVPDMRTPLPIDLHPGRAVTLAVRVTPPAQPGAYRLTLTMVQEQVRWLNEDAFTLPVHVVAAVPPPVPEGWTVLAEAPADYNEDHLRGQALLADWLTAHAPPHPRVLEVGGNAAPMTAGMAGELVNVDVDLLGLQVAHMLARRREQRIQQICADAFDLPYPAGWFDAIVIFASLHHFPDPAALLAQLARRLRPGGFIGLFCEPVGHIWPGAITPQFLAELERGVNEQSFSLREYETMFRRAELSAAEVIVDMNSLKARLVHAAPDGREDMPR